VVGVELSPDVGDGGDAWLTTLSVIPTTKAKSALPSAALIAFLIGNYFILRAWLTTRRAIAIHLTSIAVVIAFPDISRDLILPIILIEMVGLFVSARKLPRESAARQIAPILVCVAVFSVINVTPWIHNFEGDYGTHLDLEGGIIMQYRAAGLNFINGDGMQISLAADPPPLFFPPGYPVIWGLIDRYVGPDRIYVVIPNLFGLAALVIGTAILTLWVTRNWWIGAGAGLLVALWPEFLMTSSQTQPGFLATVAAFFSVFALYWALRRNEYWMVLPAVLAVGAAYLRGEYLLMPVALAIVVYLLHRSQGTRRWAFIIGVSVLLIAPWTIQNSVQHETFIPMNTGLGLSLLLGLAQIQESGELGLIKSDAFVFNSDPPELQGLHVFDPEREQDRTSRAITLISENKLWVITHIPRRWPVSFKSRTELMVRGSPGIFSRSDVTDGWSMGDGWYEWTGGRGPWFARILAGLGVKVLLAIGGITSVCLIMRRKLRPDLLLLMALPAYLFMSFSLLHLRPLHLVGLWPILVVLTAVAADHFARGRLYARPHNNPASVSDYSTDPNS
jgi:hypothetical protein